jgi:hypothetical protein
MTRAFQMVAANTQADLDRYGVREFAAEFDHKPVGLPLLLWFYGEELVAYVEVRHVPVLFPAVHPNINPRVFLEGGRKLCQMVRKYFENGYVIYDYRSAKFEPEAMRRLGFQLSPLKFFEPETPDGQSPENTEL